PYFLSLYENGKVDPIGLNMNYGSADFRAKLTAGLQKMAGEDGPYLVQLFDDPWGRDYVYEAPADEGALPRLFSLGPDGLAGTRDDLRPGTNFFDVGTAWTNGWLHRQQRLPQIELDVQPRP
ncbi:MAG: type II secretion system protein GspG, partial [Victivallales bacterium]|nr:type II secretion system protein GspG [Victivallales bacterium]